MIKHDRVSHDEIYKKNVLCYPPPRFDFIRLRYFDFYFYLIVFWPAFRGPTKAILVRHVRIWNKLILIFWIYYLLTKCILKYILRLCNLNNNLYIESILIEDLKYWPKSVFWTILFQHVQFFYYFKLWNCYKWETDPSSGFYSDIIGGKLFLIESCRNRR